MPKKSYIQFPVLTFLQSTRRNFSNFLPGGLEMDAFRSICETRGIFPRHTLRVKSENIEKGRLSLRLPVAIPEHKLPPTVRIAALIDHAGGFGSWTCLNSSQFLGTVDLRVDYLQHIPTDEDIIADATVIGQDDKFIRTDVVCWNASRSIKLALGRLLFSIYPSPIASKAPPEDYFDLEEKARLYRDEVMSIGVAETRPGLITGKLAYKDNLLGNRFLRILHGGVTAGFMERCGHFCAQSLLNDEDMKNNLSTAPTAPRSVNTVDLDVTFLKGAPMGGNLLCEAIVSSRSTRLVRVDLTVWDTEKSKKIAAGGGLYMTT